MYRSKKTTLFLKACSILYRTKLPFFLVLNKCDVTKPDQAVSWMTDFEAFQAAIDDHSGPFMTDLTRSLSLVLDTFYEKLKWCLFKKNLNKITIKKYYCNF
jgi:ribosome biogenesis GTPase A